jgi:hypothetical protein
MHNFLACTTDIGGRREPHIAPTAAAPKYLSKLLD